jgi:hypothetical protein
MSADIERVELYGGEVLLMFDKNAHRYYVEDPIGSDMKEVPGVTSILEVIDKSGPMIWWSVGCMEEQLLKRLEKHKVYYRVYDAPMQGGVNLRVVEDSEEPELADDLLEEEIHYQIEAEVLEEMVKSAKSAHTRVSKKAADIGTMAHTFIEEHVKYQIEHKGKKSTRSKPSQPQVRQAFEAFLGWEKDNKPYYLHTERYIYSRKYGYAGTIDAEVNLNKGLGALDFKTSKAIYPQYRLQLAAYIQARHEEEGGYYTQNHLIRIGKDGTLDVEKLGDWRQYFKGFKACIDLNKSLEKPKKEKK